MQISALRNEFLIRAPRGVYLTARLNPFVLAREKTLIPPFMTIRQIVKSLPKTPGLRTQAIVWVGKEEIPEDKWDSVRTLPGADMAIAIVPRGGGGKKNPLNAILTIALMVAAPQIGAALGTTVGLGITGAGVLTAGQTAFFNALVGGAFSIVGRMAINAVAPPPKPRKTSITSAADKPTMFIQGARNQLLPDGRVPSVIGTVRMMPPYGARPYTEIVGNDQYVRMLFVWGHGPVELSSLRIGATALSAFQGVEVEHRYGYMDDAPITLYSNTVLQNDLQVALKNTTSTLTSDAISITGGNTINLPPDHGLVFAVDDVLTMKGWSDAANNIEATIAAVTENSITTAEALVNDAGGEDVTIDISGWTVRTTEPDCDEITFDICCLGGLVEFTATSAKKVREVQVVAQYALTGTNNWSAPASGWLAVAQQETANIRKLDLINRQQIHRIVMDPASGEISVIAGDIVKLPAEPVAPAVPEGFIKIASVLRTSAQGTEILADYITDERADAIAAGLFENPTDFEPLPDDPLSARVRVAAGGLKFPALILKAKQTSAVRLSGRFVPPARGQYDVRWRRTTKDSSSDKIIDATTITALRTIKHVQPVLEPGIAMTAVRIKATDQLNGVVDTFNGIVTRLIPDYDSATETWIADQPTANCASAYRFVMKARESLVPLTDAEIDAGTLQDWHAACAAAGYTYNAIIDSDISVRSLLEEIAAAGRAARHNIEGRWGVVRDVLQETPANHYTPHNSWGFYGRKELGPRPHGFRVKFLNAERDWLPDERVVYADGYNETNATEVETLELPGITSWDLVYRHTRYHLAVAWHRRETYSFSADFENLVNTRGDLISFSHDVPKFGIASGRIKSVGTGAGFVLSITCTNAFTMEAGKSYSVRIRLRHGVSMVKSLVTVPGTSSTLTFATPFADAGDPRSGDLVMFGESGNETIDAVIKTIIPGRDLTAQIICVPAAPEVHSADGGELPAPSAPLPPPSDMLRPPAPKVTSIQSDDTVVKVNPDGSISPRIVVTLEAPEFNTALFPVVSIGTAEESEWFPANFTASGNQIIIEGVEAGEIYDIKICYRAAELHIPVSPPTEIANHAVGALSGAMPDVEDFTVNILGAQAFLSWTAVDAVNLSHYRIKYSPAVEGATWASSIDLVEKISAPSTSVTVEALPGTYLIKAVDASGLSESAAAATAVSPIAGIPGFNAVETVTEDPAFAGAKVDVEVSGGALRLVAADTIDDWGLIDDVPDFDLGEEGLASPGTYTFAGDVDLGDVYTSRITAEIEVTGENVSDFFDGPEPFDGEEAFDAAIDPAGYAVRLQLRSTDDDPAGAPVWTDWKDFVIGDYTGRAFQFRIILQSLAAGVTPRVSALKVTVDMPDRVEGQSNIPSGAAPCPVNFARTFKATPHVVVTPHNMATGDYFTITGKTPSGFTVSFFNAGAGAISRNFDYVAQGYGSLEA